MFLTRRRSDTIEADIVRTFLQWRENTINISREIVHTKIRSVAFSLNCFEQILIRSSGKNLLQTSHCVYSLITREDATERETEPFQDRLKCTVEKWTDNRDRVICHSSMIFSLSRLDIEESHWRDDPSNWKFKISRTWFGEFKSLWLSTRRADNMIASEHHWFDIALLRC